MSPPTNLFVANREELKTEWLKTFGHPAPARVGSVTMARILCSEQQWSKGGVSRISLMKKLQAHLVANRTSKPMAREGTRLIREWHGKEHVVDVMDGAYRWNGKEWRSLSAIAKEITGTKWSGPRFFGVSS